MSDFIKLLGSEEVAQAARNIAGAAEQMSRAAQQIEDSTHRLLSGLDEKLALLEQILDQAQGWK
jgi:methyl-accepting chemotaxis protein